MKKLPSTNESPVAVTRAAAGAPLTIGWKERVDFPAWGIRRVKVKIDTGARTSALDVASYDLREVDGQGLVAELRLALHRRRPAFRHAPLRAPGVAAKIVRECRGVSVARPGRGG